MDRCELKSALNPAFDCSKYFNNNLPLSEVSLVAPYRFILKFLLPSSKTFEIFLKQVWPFSISVNEKFLEVKRSGCIFSVPVPLPSLFLPLSVA